ncbi:MAG: hypothetical protein R2748_12360 [Bryobacterales bacterium]
MGIDDPAALPPNARIEVSWDAPDLPGPAFQGERGDLHARGSGGWSKTLHALDPDVTLVYRAPVDGKYALRIAAVTDREDPLPAFHRDLGRAPAANPLPVRTPDPSGAWEMTAEITPLDALRRSRVCCSRPNPTTHPSKLSIRSTGVGDADRELRVIGSHDELEYFENAQSGKGPDDWYRIVYRGSKTKLLTANLQMAEPVVSGRIRVYKQGEPSAEELTPSEPPKREDFGNANPVPYVHPPAEIIPGPEPVYTYYDGRDINERIHQQDDNFRAFVSRRLHPGETYYLRVEANQPAYELVAGDQTPRLMTTRAGRGALGGLPVGRGGRLADPSAAEHRSPHPRARRLEPFWRGLHELPHAVGRMGCGGRIPQRLSGRAGAAKPAAADQHDVREPAPDHQARRRGLEHLARAQ